MKSKLLRRALPATLLIGMAGMAFAQDVELYDRPDFRGMRLTLQDQTPDLEQYGIGGRVSSVVVHRGTWEFCTQPRFDGACVTVGPGRYDRLPPALHGQLASLRQIEDRWAPPGVARGRAPLVLVDSEDFRGERARIHGPTPDLRAEGFNNEARAVIVREGTWELCGQTDFRGRCVVVGPGRHVLPEWFAGRVSSVRPSQGVAVYEPPATPQESDAVITLYDRSNLQGRWLRTTGSIPNLRWENYDDVARSVDVRGGRWELCSHAEFRGECVVLRPGRHILPQRFAGRVSSIRPLG